MFTGIVTDIATVKNLEFNNHKDLLISLKLNRPDNRKLENGCSISCNGICLTLINNIFEDQDKIVCNFQASQETIKKTNIKNWSISDRINIEFALRIGDEIGGHLVSGHIDDVVKILDIKPINEDSYKFKIAAPQHLQKFIVQKGSIVLNGVSLTVNETSNEYFNVNIIKHTFEYSNFKYLKVGDEINIEVDLIARYLEKLSKK